MKKEPATYKINVESREQIIRLGKELLDLSEYKKPVEEISERHSEEFRETYHMGFATLRAIHNSPATKDFYFILQIFGYPPEKIYGWLRNYDASEVEQVEPEGKLEVKVKKSKRKR